MPQNGIVACRDGQTRQQLLTGASARGMAKRAATPRRRGRFDAQTSWRLKAVRQMFFASIAHYDIASGLPAVSASRKRLGTGDPVTAGNDCCVSTMTVLRRLDKIAFQSPPQKPSHALAEATPSTRTSGPKVHFSLFRMPHLTAKLTLNKHEHGK